MDGDQPMVSYSTGSMNSLVDKLTKLKNHPDIIRELRQDLVTLQEDFFNKFARRREMNLQVEAWMKHVRELVFDIEDWIHRKPVLTGMGDQQTKIEEEIEEFKAQIKQARELCERYNLLAVQVPTDVHDPAVVPGQDRIDSALLFEKKNGLVGVDGPIEELVRLLTGKDEKKLKVVSILGKEGLGKTNLAKEIYAKPQLHRQFECHAFVTLGRRPSMRATLIEILRQVKLDSIHEHQGHSRSRSGRGTAKDLQKIITELWEYLGTKRYFILVDGLWSTRAWKVINCALPNENRGSRVLTTTCMTDVAKCCSVHPADVYQMKVLTEEDSTSLYQQSIQQEESSANYDKVTKNMLEMCGGMPLAISVTAGLSGMTSEEQEELANMFGNCFLSSQEQYSTSEGMMKILHMSYAALSLPLKSCFLYLSVFREDYIIRKDRLIQLWVAEGFIPGDEERLWDTGEKYFNELIIRRLIQPVFDYDDDQAVGCTVHSVILDFIRAMSSKGNFVTVSGAELSSGLFSGSTDMIRRFSLNCYKDEDDDEGASGSGSDNGTLGLSTLHLSRVRSVSICGDIEGMVGRSALTVSGEIKGTPVLQSFKLLRVLDLEGTDHLRSRHLQGIVGLVLLRYLGVAGTDIDELPEEIGELEQLETLDLRQTKKLSTLPTSIAKLKRLARLLIDGTINLSSEILKMQCLEQLSTAGVDSIHSMDSVVELLKTSERLRVLGVRLEGSHLSSDNKSVKSFLMEVEKSTKLRSLSLACVHKDLLGLLMEFPPSYHLPRFELAISFPIIGVDVHKMAPLVSVTHMEIEIDQLDHGAVRVLGGLPNLVLLKLVSSGIINSQSRKSKKSPISSAQKRCMVGTADGFKCLKVFWLRYQYGGTELEFTAGAMPDLQRLSLRFSAWETLSLYGDFSFGIQNLPSLTRVHATINCKAATVSEVKDAEDAIKEQAADTAIREEATGQVSSVPMTEFSTINQHMMLLPDKEHTTTSPGRVSRFISSFTKGIHSNK